MSRIWRTSRKKNKSVFSMRVFENLKWMHVNIFINASLFFIIICINHMLSLYYLLCLEFDTERVAIKI